MKNKIILVWIIILSINYSLCINAQDNFLQETTIGIKFGANFSRIHLDTILNQNLLPGYTGGMVFRVISEPHLGIQLEFNYAQKGWSEKLDSINIYKKQLNYLEIPIMTRVEIGNGNTKITMDLGPYLSCLIFEKQTMNIINANEIKNYYNNNIDNKFEYGFCVGLGILRKTSIGSFELEFRYSQSLSNIFDPNRYTTMSTSQNQVFSASILYLIKI